jgi:hypothetical protein
VPLDVAEADKLLPLERRPAALATCLCSICEPDDVGPLLECLPSLTEANSDTILTSSGDALQAHAVAARASADLVDESRRAAGAAAVLGQQGALRGGATRLSGPPGATMTEQAELLGTINRRLAGAVEALYGSNSAVNVDVLWDEADTQCVGCLKRLKS